MDLRRAALFATLLLAAAPGARTQETAATAVERDLKIAKVHMKLERWAEAAKAFLVVFERNTGSPEVVRRVGDIEADLKVCLFRAQAKMPSDRDLFGGAAKSLDLSSRKIVLCYHYGATRPDWECVPGSSGVLKIPLEGDVSVDFKANFEDERTHEY